MTLIPITSNLQGSAPTGPAGGSLSGNYPDPTIAVPLTLTTNTPGVETYPLILAAADDGDTQAPALKLTTVTAGLPPFALWDDPADTYYGVAQGDFRADGSATLTLQAGDGGPVGIRGSFLCKAPQSAVTDAMLANGEWGIAIDFSTPAAPALIFVARGTDGNIRHTQIVMT